jgi:hypothetical protein
MITQTSENIPTTHSNRIPIIVIKRIMQAMTTVIWKFNDSLACHLTKSD